MKKREPQFGAIPSRKKVAAISKATTATAKGLWVVDQPPVRRHRVADPHGQRRPAR